MTNILYPAEKKCPDNPEHEMSLREGFQWWCHKCNKFYGLNRFESRLLNVGNIKGRKELQAELCQILGVK